MVPPNPSEGVNVINAASNWTASILEIAQMVAAALPGVSIRARSDHPPGGHHLRVDSSLASLRRSVEESQGQMRSVISSLLHLRQQS